MRRILELTTCAAVLFFGAATHARQEAAGAALTRLQQLAIGKLTLPAHELARIVSDALTDPAAIDEALLAISGRGALARRYDAPAEAVGRWRAERAALETLRPAVRDLLAHETQRTRLNAVLALATLGLDPDRLPSFTIGEMSLRDLTNAYKDQSMPLVRVEIIKIAALCDDASPLRRDLLRDALSDPGEGVVAQAVRGLGALRDQSSMELIGARLTHEDRNVRLAAANALANFGRAAQPFLGRVEAAAKTESDPIVRKTLEALAVSLRGADDEGSQLYGAP